MILPIRRLKTIAVSAATRLLITFGSVIVSIVVIRTQSEALWGSFIHYALIMDFSFSIVSWGSTYYLQREFSFRPGSINNALSRSISSRLILVFILVSVLLIMNLGLIIKMSLIIWALSRFVQQSFEPLAQTERHFTSTLVIELLALATAVVPILSIGVSNTETLVFLFALGSAVRGLAFAWMYRSYTWWVRPDFRFFLDSLPFLLLALSGMLLQRVDIYCVAYLLDDAKTAQYQVLLNFLIFSQFAASLLLSPYTKNIFRLSRSSFLKLERNFMLYGVILSAVCIAVIAVAIPILYKLSLPWSLYVCGYFYILMFYLYLLRNYALGKESLIKRITIISFWGSFINLLVAAFLIPRYGLVGALLSATSAQVIIVILYHNGNVPECLRRQGKAILL